MLSMRGCQWGHSDSLGEFEPYEATQPDTVKEISGIAVATVYGVYKIRLIHCR
jgi:hypothetical protein